MQSSEGNGFPTRLEGFYAFLCSKPSNLVGKPFPSLVCVFSSSWLSCCYTKNVVEKGFSCSRPGWFNTFRSSEGCTALCRVSKYARSLRCYEEGPILTCMYCLQCRYGRNKGLCCIITKSIVVACRSGQT